MCGFDNPHPGEAVIGDFPIVLDDCVATLATDLNTVLVLKDVVALNLPIAGEIVGGLNRYPIPEVVED
jgi:hypothetical protein